MSKRIEYQIRDESSLLSCIGDKVFEDILLTNTFNYIKKGILINNEKMFAIDFVSSGQLIMTLDFNYVSDNHKEMLERLIIYFESIENYENCLFLKKQLK